MNAAASSRSFVAVSVHLTVRATSTSLPRIPLLKSYGQPRCLLARAQSSGAHKYDTECPQMRHCQGGIREGVELLLWLESSQRSLWLSFLMHAEAGQCTTVIWKSIP